MAAPDYDFPNLSSLFSDEQDDDENRALQFQLQEVLTSSLAMNQHNQETVAPVKPETVAGDVGEPSMRFCEICTETKPSNQTFSIPNCNHGFCNECIGKHVQAKVETNAHNIMCPALNCKEPIDYERCVSIVPRSALEKWGELLCEASIGAAQKFYCPFKDCSEIMFRDTAEEITAAECGACHRLFCARCKIAWHSDIGCEEFQGLGDNERAREDLMLKSLAREKKWGLCPSCKYVVEKTEGCNHMVCRSVSSCLFAL